jgi:subtilisin family serine protease
MTKFRGDAVSERNTWDQGLEPTASDEVRYIVREFAENNIPIGFVTTDDGGVAFMYAEDQLLAREQYLGPLREVLDDRFDVVVAKRVIRDIVLLHLSRSGENNGKSPESDDTEAESDGKSASGHGKITKSEFLDLLDEIDARLGPGIVTPNHVVTVSPVAPCPATEPQEIYGVPEPYPAICPGDNGAGVRIYIADTGLLPSAAASFPWLQSVQGDDDLRIAANGTIKPYGGHGTFVAGVVRSMAPGAEIVVENVFDIAGSALESDFVPKLNAGFGYGAEIFHLTIASTTRNGLPLLPFEVWLETLQQYKGVLCVVAAGNNGNRLPCWPGAFSGVLSVGALASDGRSRAYFSNYGGWVDVYAPGQNLINAYGSGTYICHVAPYAGERRKFFGLAQWSGTSFSSPLVTGLIAARMARCGESAQEAAAVLMAKARAQTIPGVGPILLPCCDDEDGCGDSGECGCDRSGGR